jgi:hypothetical protein
MDGGDQSPRRRRPRLDTCRRCARDGQVVYRRKGDPTDRWLCFACVTDEHVSGVWLDQADGPEAIE